MKLLCHKSMLGEIEYHLNIKEYVADVIASSKYRGNGYGKESFRLICEAAKEKGIGIIYDDIAIDNSAINMFLDFGFAEEYRTV